MNCAECGQHLPEGARFCTACGRRVEPVLVCPQCQTQAPEGAKFCFNCGAALAAHSSAAGAAAPPPRPAPPRAASPAAAPAAPPERVEPRLDLNKVRNSPSAGDAPVSGGRKEPVVRMPGSSSEPKKPKSAPRNLRKTWPLGMVVLGLCLAAAIYWSDSRDDIRVKAEAERRIASAIEAPDGTALSTRGAVPGMSSANPQAR